MKSLRTLLALSALAVTCVVGACADTNPVHPGARQLSTDSISTRKDSSWDTQSASAPGDSACDACRDGTGVVSGGG